MYNELHRAPDVAQHEIYREVAIQSSLQHPNIIHLFGAFQVSGSAQALIPYNSWKSGNTFSEQPNGSCIWHVCASCRLPPCPLKGNTLVLVQPVWHCCYSQLQSCR